MGTKLSERVEHLRTLQPGLVRPLGVVRDTELPRWLTTVDRDYDWLVVRLVDDPSYQRGELDVPPAQRDRLQRIERHGLVFDDLWIAHEVPKALRTEASSLDGGAKGHAGGAKGAAAGTEALAPGTKDGVATADHPAIDVLRTTAELPAAPAAARLSKVVGALTGALAATVAAPLALATLAAGADPILLGVLFGDTDDVAVLVELARW